MARSSALNDLVKRAREESGTTDVDPTTAEERRSFLTGLGGGPRAGTVRSKSDAVAVDDPVIEEEARAIEKAASAPISEPAAVVDHVLPTNSLYIGDESLLEGISSPGLTKQSSSDDPFATSNPHPLRLASALSREYGTDWLSWEPETIWGEIRELVGAEPPAAVKDMVMAIMALLTTDNFWTEHHIFLWTVQALNGTSPDFTVLPEPRPEELAFAVYVANQIRDNTPITTPNGETVDIGIYYNRDVTSAIATSLFLRGLVWAPRPFQGHGDVDEETGLALPDTNEILGSLMDPDGRALANRVAKAWATIEAEGIEDLESPEDTPESVQIAHLFSIRNYVKTHAR